jgi:hypothetical protein
MKAARSSVLRQRNRLLSQTLPSRTQSRRVLSTSGPVASSSTSSSPSAHAHAHGKAFNSSLAVDSTAVSKLPEFTAVNQSETSRTHYAPTSPKKQYEKLVQSGVIQGDDHQVRIVGKLQRFWEQLLQYDPPSISEVNTSSSLVMSFLFSLITANPFATRCLVYFFVHLQYQIPHLHRRQKDFTSMVTLALARQCLWTSFTKHYPHLSHASVAYTFTPS